MSARPMDTSSHSDRMDDFRITASAEIAAMLKRLADANMHLSLSSPRGDTITATLWTVDARRGMVGFSLRADEPQLDAIVESDEAMVVGYLDSIKLQFDVQDLVLVHRGGHKALNAAFPRELFRFQRRNGFRVQPMLRSSPVARV